MTKFYCAQEKCTLIDEGKQARKRSIVLIRMASLIVVAMLLFVAGDLLLDYIPRFGLPPCTEADWLFHPLRGLIALLICSSIWLLVRLYRTPTWSRLMVAAALPLTALAVQALTSDHEARRQQQCESRTLDEAMTACRADPAHYRRSKSKVGADVLTLMSPGTTDKAWQCLETWAIRRADISLEVDESIYRPRAY